MRHGAPARRSRNRGNNSGRKGNQGRTQVFDSNGPDVRIRGTAQQIYEKYEALAKDAASSGDRVVAESYLQHAEHYMRIINSFVEISAPDQAASGQGSRSDQVVRGDNDADQSVKSEAQDQDEDLGLPASIVGKKAVSDTTRTLEDA